MYVTIFHFCATKLQKVERRTKQRELFFFRDAVISSLSEKITKKMRKFYFFR